MIYSKANLKLQQKQFTLQEPELLSHNKAINMPAILTSDTYLTENTEDARQLIDQQLEYSVSEISNIIKHLVEENFSHIRIRGEISGLKAAPSGHVYFSLKDDNAVIAAVCWRGSISKLTVKPEEGLEVICIGFITTYAGQSKYQLIAEQFEVAGIGALMTLFAKRKEKLQAEGLFALERKKALPRFPTKIGIVTSAIGAVIRDILIRLQDRMPVHVIVWPVLVQGEQAASQIASAINGFNKLEAKPDIVIVARGGGSIEDLWAFNEEIVVRAVADSIIPLISAIGHETDTTLIDYVSDVRASTPTAAAEIAVPVRRELILKLDNYKQNMDNNLLKLINNSRNYLSALTRTLPNYRGFFINLSQRLDYLISRMNLTKFFLFKQSALNNSVNRLKTPHNSILIKQNQIEYLGQLLNKKASSFLQQSMHNLQLSSLKLAPKDLIHKLQSQFSRLNKSAMLLDSYHYHNVLNRGFVIVRDEQQHLVTSSQKLFTNQIAYLEFKDGVKKVIIQ